MNEPLTNYPAEGLDALYTYEKEHFWFRHRVRVILDAFHRFVGRDENILEVGAGTGHTARALLQDGYSHLSVGEIHRTGLLYARSYGLTRLYQFDLRAVPFVAEFDAVALFDVIEHIAEEDTVAANLRAMLRPGGRVLLTVPAHQWLWSRIDELSGHHRRYTTRSMTELLERNGFDVIECRYFFTALVPALLVRSLLARRTTREKVADDCGLTVSQPSNIAFMVASKIGDAVLAPLRRFTGGSLLVVAQRRD